MEEIKYAERFPDPATAVLTAKFCPFSDPQHHGYDDVGGPWDGHHVRHEFHPTQAAAGTLVGRPVGHRFDHS